MTIKQLPPFEFLSIAVEALKKTHKNCDKWQNTFDEMFNGHFVPTFNEPLETAVIKMVELAFNDEPHPEYGSMFSWWVYDTEFGKKKDLADSVLYNKKKIPMRTVKDLYNYYLMINEE